MLNAFVTGKTVPDTAVQADIETVARIDAVPTILDVVCRTTGMGFAAIARVTEDRWIACGVKDDIRFGLAPGGELDLDTTICNEIKASRTPVVINHVDEDATFATHRTPKLYGFQSYISMRIILSKRSNSEGLGLGLYIASEIAKAHEGTLDVASSDAETCFSFCMTI